MALVTDSPKRKQPCILLVAQRYLENAAAMDPRSMRKLQQRFSQLISNSEDALDDLLNAMTDYNEALTRSVIQAALRMGVGTELIGDASGGIDFDRNLCRPRPLTIRGIDPAPIVAEVQWCATALTSSEELLKRAVACSTDWRTNASKMRSMVALRLSPRRATSNASDIAVEARLTNTLSSVPRDLHIQTEEGNTAGAP